MYIPSIPSIPHIGNSRTNARIERRLLRGRLATGNPAALTGLRRRRKFQSAIRYDCDPHGRRVESRAPAS